MEFHNEERMFVIGVRKDICEKIGIKEEVEIKKLFPIGSSYAPSVCDTLSTLNSIKRQTRDCTHKTIHKENGVYEIIRAIPKKINHPDSMNITRVSKTFTSTPTDVLGEPAPTITQSGSS